MSVPSVSLLATSVVIWLTWPTPWNARRNGEAAKRSSALLSRHPHVRADMRLWPRVCAVRANHWIRITDVAPARKPLAVVVLFAARRRSGADLIACPRWRHRCEEYIGEQDQEGDDTRPSTDFCHGDLREKRSWVLPVPPGSPDSIAGEHRGCTCSTTMRRGR